MFKIFSYSGVGTVKARPWSETRGGPDQVRHRKLRFILCVFRSYAYRFERQASLLYDTIGLVCMAVVFHLVCRKQKIPVPLTAVQITGTYYWMAKSSAECAFSDELIFWEVESCTGAIGGDALALSTPGPVWSLPVWPMVLSLATQKRHQGGSCAPIGTHGPACNIRSSPDRQQWLGGIIIIIASGVYHAHFDSSHSYVRTTKNSQSPEN